MLYLIDTCYGSQSSCFSRWPIIIRGFISFIIYIILFKPSGQVEQKYDDQWDSLCLNDKLKDDEHEDDELEDE